MSVGAGGGLFVNEPHLHQGEGAGGLHIHTQAADQKVALDLTVGKESVQGLIGDKRIMLPIYTMKYYSVIKKNNI